ncbi:hypothetical protein GQ43DRAFT_442262 [Delitschia confertaspora ATCC 74209]|uniref:Uncharacterized protein n=1 Tax=Delitschia confertaspora ATCC 74209 TaxID=1513339 RepID=A0A9P4JM47_9PLEO|nr:hypothetical protein GQ43DRAFT_442262 [Delitschia confertaspora ATCC 74209]
MLGVLISLGLYINTRVVRWTGTDFSPLFLSPPAHSDTHIDPNFKIRYNVAAVEERSANQQQDRAAGRTVFQWGLECEKDMELVRGAPSRCKSCANRVLQRKRTSKMIQLRVG